MERLQIFNVSISKSNIKYPIEKSIFAANLPLKLFPATVASCWHWKSKVSPYFPLKCLYHMPVKFKQNRMVETIQNLTKNWVFNNHFWQGADAILEDVSVAETIICLILKYQFSDYLVSSFSVPKITIARHV